MLGFAGVTEMDDSATTSRDVEPVRAPSVAVTVTVPNVTPVTTPAEVTVAIAGAEETQATWVVRSPVVPSE
jgi:hypothetical protein